MGQAWRALSYPYAANAAEAVAALSFEGRALRWHRLDDGVMGGRSESGHAALPSGGLRFAGVIDTLGGGFASIRANLDAPLPARAAAIRVRVRGDGRTYKLLLSNGEPSGPWSNNPSWQADIATRAAPGAEPDEVVLPLSAFVPTFGGAPFRGGRAGGLALVPQEMRQLGLMLSLYLSDGRPNPPETFGTGAFSFALDVSAIEAVQSADGASCCEACTVDSGEGSGVT